MRVNKFLKLLLLFIASFSSTAVVGDPELPSSIQFRSEKSKQKAYQTRHPYSHSNSFCHNYGNISFRVEEFRFMSGKLMNLAADNTASDSNINLGNPYNSFIYSKVVSASDVCVIVEHTDATGTLFYTVLSEIANEVLLSIIKQVCLRIVGKDNQDICDAINSGIDMLISFKGVGKGLGRILSKKIFYEAERKTSNSSLKFFAETLQLAYDVKNTLDALQKHKIIDWTRISSSVDLKEKHNYIGNVNIQNVTDRTIALQFSIDGDLWETRYFEPGEFIVNFWNGKLNQDYALLRGEKICKHQVFTGKSYKLRYNQFTKQFQIEHL